MADSDAAQTPEPLTPSTSTAPVLIHPRREPFEYGLLSIPKLVFSDGLQTLSHVKWTLLLAHINHRVSTETVAWVLQIPVEHSRLLIETLASVLHDDSDPVVKARARKEVDAAGVNVFDLLIFLYIQSYKRLLPKGHKDSATVADVWPSTSALQLVRCNSRRLMPSHADEVAHQLSYLQKHLSNIISLLSDVSEGEDETMVLSLEKFEHLGFLVYSGEKRPEKIPLSQNTPFFANSDPDMPAAPILASHVLDWLLQNISYTLERMSDRASSKENSPSNTSDQDVTMADVGVVSTKPSSSLKGPTLIEGVSKASYVKQATDLNNTSVKVVNCHESVIYILAPMKYATVYGCSDATIVLGAVGKAVRVEHCERVHLITATKRICIANCRECLFFLGVNQPPFFVGDNHKLQVAPYNTFYPQLEEHLSQVGIDPNINKWGEPVVLGMVDPHDSLSHPAGVSDVQSESVTRLESDLYTSFVIPNWVGGEQDGCTKDNPFPLSDPYLASQKKKGYVEPEIASNAAVVPSSDEEISDDSTTDLPRLRRREDKKLKKLLGIKKVYDAGERKEKDVQSGERKEKDVQSEGRVSESEGRVSERRVSKSAGHRRWWRRLRYYTSGLAALNGTRR